MGKFQSIENTFVTQENPAFKIIIFTIEFKSIWNLKPSYDFFDPSGTYLLSEAKNHWRTWSNLWVVAHKE